MALQVHCSCEIIWVRARKERRSQRAAKVLRKEPSFNVFQLRVSVPALYSCRSLSQNTSDGLLTCLVQVTDTHDDSKGIIIMP